MKARRLAVGTGWVRGVGAFAPLVLLVLAGCDLGVVRGPEVGTRAPEYRAETLAGEAVALDDLRGQVVMLNVWATWCRPCVREMPSFQRLHSELEGAGLRIVAVSIDRAGSRGDIERFLDTHGITFDILHDPKGGVQRTFSTIGVPETFLIGRDGTVLRHWIGMIDATGPSVRGAVLDALAGRPLRPAGPVAGAS